MKTLCTLLIPFFLVSCGVYYKNPPEQLGKTALIKSSNNRTSLYNWSNFKIDAIDNLPVNYNTSLTATRKKNVVTQGFHNIVIVGSFNQSLFGGGPYEATGHLYMHFKGGRSYIANGKRNGSRLNMWIEDSQTRQIVSPIIKVPYRKQAQTYYYFIPSS